MAPLQVATCSQPNRTHYKAASRREGRQEPDPKAFALSRRAWHAFSLCGEIKRFHKDAFLDPDLFNPGHCLMGSPFGPRETEGKEFAEYEEQKPGVRIQKPGERWDKADPDSSTRRGQTA